MFEKVFDAYIRGSFPLIHICSSEYDRVFESIMRYVKNNFFDFGFSFAIYNSLKGLAILHPEETENESDFIFNSNNYIPGTSELENALVRLLEKENVVFVMRNLHLYLDDYFRRSRLIDLLYQIYEKGISDHISFVDISPSPIPMELSNYFVVIDFPLPDEKEIKKVAVSLLKQENIKVKKSTLESIVRLCKGMSKAEIENALALSISMENKIDLNIIKSEKSKIVKKSGLLEWIEDVPNIDEVGGLENLKEYFKKVSKVINNYEKAKKYGIHPPKGCLLVGIPGTGKTLSAKAIASLFNVPLYRLDISKLFGSLVGETEKNVREALKVIDAVSPSVILIDEIEKAFSGYHSSSQSDSGVTARLVGSFLYYFQEKKSLSFFVCTSNNLSLLPPEMLRKGRFDEIWYVDIPTLEERKEIWRIHLKKTGRKLSEEAITFLARKTEHFTGAEIEAIIQEALYNCFYEDREPTVEDFVSIIDKTNTFYEREKNLVSALKRWVKACNIRVANAVVFKKEAPKQKKGRLLQ